MNPDRISWKSVFFYLEEEHGMKWVKLIFAPFAWLFGIRKDSVIVHSYSPFIFTWPLILLGYLFYPLVNSGWMQPATAGWIYATAMILVLLTMGIDINRNATIFWLVFVLGSWFGIILLSERGFTLFGKIGHFMANLKPNWSADMGLATSILMTIFYALVVGNAWLNDRWRFIAGEIEHWSFGRNDDSMGRGAKVISTSYPDFLELLLMLSGTVTIYNAQKTMVLARIPRVPLLPFRVKLINRLLESVQVTPAARADEEAAAAAEAEHAAADAEHSAQNEAEDGTLQS
jgi:hypothetical protein